jgi:hypothetical protein
MIHWRLQRGCSIFLKNSFFAGTSFVLGGSHSNRLINRNTDVAGV